jgi:hypothetical protein
MVPPIELAHAKKVNPKYTEFTLVNSCTNSIKFINDEQTIVTQQIVIMKLYMLKNGF